MGNLINPISSRLGYVTYWDSIWASTSVNNYSMTLHTDMMLKKYLSKLIERVSLTLNTQDDPKISSFKLINLHNTVNVVLYFWVEVWTEDTDFMRALAVSTVKKFIQIQRIKVRRRIRKAWAKKKQQEQKRNLLKIKQLNKLAAAKSKVLKPKTATVPNKKKVTLQSKGNKLVKPALKNNIVSRIIKKPKTIKKNKILKVKVKPRVVKKRKLSKVKKINSKFKHLKSVLNRKVFKEMKKISRYDAYRREAVIFSPMIKSASILRAQLMLNSASRVNKTKNKGRAMWDEFISFLIYKTKLSSIKEFLKLSLRKYLGNTKSISFLFVRHTPNLLTSSLLADYFVGRLHANHSLRSLIKTFIRNMRHQMHGCNLLGFKVVCSGRFARRGRASYEWKSIGRIANTNFKLDVDYTLRLVTLTNSICAIKIWLVRPDQNEHIFLL